MIAVRMVYLSLPTIYHVSSWTGRAFAIFSGNVGVDVHILIYQAIIKSSHAQK